MGKSLAHRVWQNHKNKQAGWGLGEWEGGLRARGNACSRTPGTLTPTPPQGSITNIRCARSPVERERPGVWKLNPGSLWPGQDTGRPWNEGQGGCTGEGMCSRGARGGVGMSRMLAELGPERFGMGRRDEPAEVRGSQTPLGPTCQLPVVQFEAAERVGAVEVHVPLGVH